MRKFIIVLAATLLMAASAQAVVVTVESTGMVIWNGINDGPLSEVNGGEDMVMSFTVDSDVFDEGTPGDTRGYVIDEASFSLSFSGGVVVGLMDPFPAGETPYFALVDGFPVSDGFWVSTSPFSPGGVPLEQDPVNFNLDLGYVEDTLSSLDILDALGEYGYDGMTRFALNFWSVFPDNVGMECDFMSMTISAPVAAEEATWSDVKALFR
jgi:hypothetical protein